MKIKTIWVFCSFLLGLISPWKANGDWTVNLGLHNPIGSIAGLNFLYFRENYAFEIGISGFSLMTDGDGKSVTPDNGDSKKERDASAEIRMGGDIDYKYFLTSSGLIPFIQGGLGYGLGGEMNGHSHVFANAGYGFAGIGLLMGSPTFYFYLSQIYLDKTLENQLWQWGFGIDI